MKIEELKRQLNQGVIDNVYLVLGQDSYLSDKVKKLFLNMIPESEREFNTAVYDMEQSSLAMAIADAISAPFFSEKKLVMIINPYFLTADNKKYAIEQNIDELQGYLENPSPDTTLVIIANYEKLDARKKIVKELKKQATLIDVSPLKENDIRKYVLKYCQNKNIQIEPEALDKLIQLTNANFTKIMNELSKLLLAVVNEKIITKQVVTQLVSKSLEQNVFDLVEFVRDKKVKEAFELYHELLEQKEQPIKINAILIGQFRLLLQVKILQQHGYAQGNIAETLKIHPFRIKLAMQSIRKFSQISLKQAYMELVEMDEKLKTTNKNPELLFQLFLLNFAENR